MNRAFDVVLLTELILWSGGMMGEEAVGWWGMFS